MIERTNRLEKESISLPLVKNTFMVVSPDREGNYFTAGFTDHFIVSLFDGNALDGPKNWRC